MAFSRLIGSLICSKSWRPQVDPRRSAISLSGRSFPPTAHRLIRALVSRGYVRQLPGRSYALGPKLIRLGDAATKIIGAWAAPHLADVVASSGETANMAVLDGAMAVYVAQVPSPHSMRMFTEVGRQVHLHCTGVGKALLLQLPDETVRNLISKAGMPAYTPNSHVTSEALLAELAQSRTRGYALDEGSMRSVCGASLSRSQVHQHRRRCRFRVP